MTTENKFADRLRELRLAAGLTQVQLAERAGLSLGTLRNWETGYRDPKTDWVLPLAAALGVEAEALFQPPENEPGTTPRSLGRPRKISAEPPQPKRPRGRPRQGGATT